MLTPLTPGPGQYGGFLGRAYEPFEAGDVTDPRQLADGLGAPADVPADRFAGRRQLLGGLDRGGRLPGSADRGELTRQAFDFLASAKARAAFDLDREPAKVRDRYGRNRAGQRWRPGRGKCGRPGLWSEQRGRNTGGRHGSARLAAEAKR